MLDRVIKFINYWYFRYLLVTELFMVEKWERVMIHIVLFAILGVISIFNTTVVLGLTSYITQSLQDSFFSDIVPTGSLPRNEL